MLNLHKTPSNMHPEFHASQFPPHICTQTTTELLVETKIC